MHKSMILAAVALFGLVVVVGCKKDGPVSAEQTGMIDDTPSTKPAVTELNAELIKDVKYYSGRDPYQPGPPTGEMKAGTKVMVMKAGPTYTRVVNEEGVAGWVDSAGVKTAGGATTKP